MADFTISSDTLNNPENWFTSSYVYDDSSKLITIDLTTALTSLSAGTNNGVTEPDLNETTGDVRSVYLALAEALFKAYDAKDDASATTSNRLKMTRSQAVDSTNNIRYTTYTIHVQEDGTGTAESFSSSGVRAE
jgi:hypothetical protein